MKAITLLLLVLVSATCLLTSQANSIESSEDSLANDLDYDLELDQLLDDYDSDSDFMDVEDLGFIRSCRKILWGALRTLLGTNCIIKEVVNVLNSCTNYLKAVKACGTEVPKDVAKVVESAKRIISLCDAIINLRSKLCAKERSVVSKIYNSFKCFWKVFRATLRLVRQIPRTLRLIAKLPLNTGSCLLSATNNVKVSLKSFLPNISVCKMT
ncbi:uncharacterized protein LOC108113667 [Drosophila eugracilis]|uniref:uncharacterized protein LOC108113667 n=1 Tax=Drosophila eugracilis TaxID=29029 RepID=UPI001BDA5C87|nr:uncharacterized protein LOC108113667 [Drosophila eugracilis]